MKQIWQQRWVMSVLALLMAGSALFVFWQDSLAFQYAQLTADQPPPRPHTPPPPPPPRAVHNEQNTLITETGESLERMKTVEAAGVTAAAGVADLTATIGENGLEISKANVLALLALTEHPAAEHIDQTELLALLKNGQHALAFEMAFEMGDELFETRFNALGGVGANMGQGFRFTQIPRADLTGKGEWANHIPRRATGPNAEACNDCHALPFDDGAGPAANNNIRDPLHSGNMAQFIQRNTPHVFAAGAVQVLAEEMTEALHALRDEAATSACATQEATTVPLLAKDVDFGMITVRPTVVTPCTYVVDATNVTGIDTDLVVRPFQWKGVIPTVRAFNRDAAHQELGVQSIEIVGEGVDGDGDGVVNEMTVGDQTGLAIYLAAQPRPTTLLEVTALGLIDPLSDVEEAGIVNGETHFEQIGCAGCHVAQLVIDDPIFHEPSQNPHYRDALFPAGQDPTTLGVDAAWPVAFDLTKDQPDNIIELADSTYLLGALTSDGQGGALAGIYGDLKRHDMGPGLAESIDDEGIPASVFLTENLWGVGSTAPYLHDGRATTLTEAILAHGGEAQASRDGFVALEQAAQQDVIAFLNNLILFKVPAEE